MTPAEPTAPRPRAAATSPTLALGNVVVTLLLFVVSFIGFLIAPWIVLGIAGTLYAVRKGVQSRSPGAPPAPDADGALQGFGGLGGAE